MGDLLLDLVTYLQVKGVVGSDGVDVFRDFSPDTPDSVVVLFEYAGTPDSVSEVGVRSTQVMVRDLNAEQARRKAWDIYNVLNVPKDRIIYLTSSRWAIILPRQTPFKIGVDEQNRILWGFNLAVTTYGD